MLLEDQPASMHGRRVVVMLVNLNNIKAHVSSHDETALFWAVQNYEMVLIFWTTMSVGGKPRTSGRRQTSSMEMRAKVPKFTVYDCRWMAGITYPLCIFGTQPSARLSQLLWLWIIVESALVDGDNRSCEQCMLTGRMADGAGYLAVTNSRGLLAGHKDHSVRPAAMHKRRGEQIIIIHNPGGMNKKRTLKLHIFANLLVQEVQYSSAPLKWLCSGPLKRWLDRETSHTGPTCAVLMGRR